MIMPGATKILNCITQVFLLPVYGIAWLLGSPYLMTLLCIMSEVLVELVVSTVMAGVSLVVSAVILMEDDNRPLQVPPVDFQKVIKNVPKIPQTPMEPPTESLPDVDATKQPVSIDTFFDMTGDGTKPPDDFGTQLAQLNGKGVTPQQEFIASEPAEVQTTAQEGSVSGLPEISSKVEKGDGQEGSATPETGEEQRGSKEEAKRASGSLEAKKPSGSLEAAVPAEGAPVEPTSAEGATVELTSAEGATVEQTSADGGPVEQALPEPTQDTPEEGTPNTN